VSCIARPVGARRSRTGASCRPSPPYSSTGSPSGGLRGERPHRAPVARGPGEAAGRATLPTLGAALGNAAALNSSWWRRRHEEPGGFGPPASHPSIGGVVRADSGQEDRAEKPTQRSGGGTSRKGHARWRPGRRRWKSCSRPRMPSAGLTGRSADGFANRSLGTFGAAASPGPPSEATPPPPPQSPPGPHVIDHLAIRSRCSKRSVRSLGTAMTSALPFASVSVDRPPPRTRAS
jgi:hypothetical protein